MSDVIDYGTAVPVKELPPNVGKRGRTSNHEPALRAWLATMAEPGKTYELPSKDKDGAHPVARVTQVRKVAGPTYKVETAAVETGKRYRIFVTPVTPGEDGEEVSANGS